MMYAVVNLYEIFEQRVVVVKKIIKSERERERERERGRERENFVVL